MERIEQEITIGNKQGLHARPAAIFVQLASKFDSAIWIEKGGEVVDGKSIITVLSLGATKGSAVKLIIEGDDAQDALAELKEFLEGEGENA